MILSSTKCFCTQRVQCLTAVLLSLAAVTVVTATRDHHLHGARILHNACCNANRTRLHGIHAGSFRIIEGWCDVTSEGEGWLVIMRRIQRENSETDVNFDKSLSEYEEGFGNLRKKHQFWYGLRVLNELTTKQEYELRVDFYNNTNDNQSFSHVTYSNFSVASACEGYRLNIGHFQRGKPHIELVDVLTQFNNQSFSGHRMHDCNNLSQKGGWWYTSNLCVKAVGKDVANDGIPLTASEKHLHWRIESTQQGSPEEIYFKKIELKIRPKTC